MLTDDQKRTRLDISRYEGHPIKNETFSILQ